MSVKNDTWQFRPIIWLITVSTLTQENFITESARFMREDFLVKAVFSGIIPVDKPMLHTHYDDVLVEFPPQPDKKIDELVDWLKSELHPYLKADLEESKLFDHVFTVLIYVNDADPLESQYTDPSVYPVGERMLLVVLNKHHLVFDAAAPFMPNASLPPLRMALILTMLLSDYLGWPDYRPQFLNPSVIQELIDSYDSSLPLDNSSPLSDHDEDDEFLLPESPVSEANKSSKTLLTPKTANGITSDEEPTESLSLRRHEGEKIQKPRRRSDNLPL